MGYAEFNGKMTVNDGLSEAAKVGDALKLLYQHLSGGTIEK
jgi:hypothetical protein